MCSQSIHMQHIFLSCYYLRIRLQFRPVYSIFTIGVLVPFPSYIPHYSLKQIMVQ
jgi:hypothetical protein